MERCPNNCKDGWKFNPYTHKRERCEYCMERRKKEVNTEELRESLRLPFSLTNGEFIPDTVFSAKGMDAVSVENVKGVMSELIGNLSIGELPDHSMLFNLGALVHEDNFLNPMVLKAYSGGFECLPVLTSLEVMVSRRLYENGDEREDIVPYTEMMKKSFCVVTIDAGETVEGLYAVKGLMQLRARNGLPTIMLTHIWTRNVLKLCSDDGINCKELATLYAVKYTGSANVGGSQANGGISPARGQITREEFENMKKSRDF